MFYIIERVLFCSVDSHLKVQMITRRMSRGTNECYNVTLLHLIANLAIKLTCVCVKGCLSAAVVDYNVVTVAVMPGCRYDLTAV